MPNLRAASFSAVIKKDIRGALRCSEEKFGQAAADRYAVLIQQALRDIQENPQRPGSKQRRDLAPDYFTYHLSFSRNSVHGGWVKAPRHFVLYSYSDDEVEFARLLHDSRELSRHLPLDFGPFKN